MARTTNLEDRRAMSYVLDDYICGEYIFNSNFDSGNLGRVELVNCLDLDANENIIHAEYNVWTTPDCFGTPNESPNRTWFFFSIRGGQPNRNVKINIKNLNRQAKLFSQGMQPVMRLGPYGKWERIKDKPICAMESDNFCMSFIHRPLEIPHLEHYYAFTYPFTYTECQCMLDRFERKWAKNPRDLSYIIKRLVYPAIAAKKTSQSSEGASTSKEYSLNSSQSSPANRNISTSETESSSYEQYTNAQLQNEIYYHRELLIHSLEGRRVDLITITSFHGIQDKREEGLAFLFPEKKERCNVFKDKKVIFLSSRVHPGETPASFVLNGFFNLLLDRKSYIGTTLRQMYVFKIVPILNPDGVFKGHYRTDTLGQNLNRMYINPKLESHPSIYAVKKLIKLYHYGYDAFEEDSSDGSSTDLALKNDSSSSSLSLDNNSIPKVELTIGKDNQTSENSIMLDAKSSTESYKDCTSSEGEEFPAHVNSSNNNGPANTNDMKAKVFTDKLIPEIKTTAHEPTVKKYPNQSFTQKSDGKTRRVPSKPILGSIHNSSGRQNDQKSKNHNSIQQRAINKKVPQKKDMKIGNAKTLSLSTGNKSTNKKSILSNYNINITSNFNARNNPLHIDRIAAGEEKGNIFLYIDFHGHASKKGVFMYGNHFQNSLEAVECMLLPRLMSVNCHHFHYDACNFSERNMYRREKRDGLSKEGSGRVAVYKMTGLIKSYTLESNYNTGKYVNILPGRGKDNMKIMNIAPPKYTPAVYEEVGRALGPSILDLTNSNCLTRIHNSDFRTMQGLRITLKNEIERNISNRTVSSHTTAKVLSAHPIAKRNKRHSLSASSTLPSNETAKENKGAYSAGTCWDSDSTGTSCKMPSTTSQSKIHLKPSRNIKKNCLKVRSSTFFGRKESGKKKPKNLNDPSILNKKDQQFHVPTKKAKVVSQKDSAQMPAPKTLSSQIASNFSHKTVNVGHECLMSCGLQNPHVEKLDDALMQNQECLFVDVGTSTDEVFHPCRSEAEYEDCKPVDASKSACNIVSLSNGANTSSSSILTILTTTAIIDDAVPSCSGMAFPTSHAKGFRENARIGKYAAKAHDISSDLKLKVQNAFGGSEKTKLTRKKRSVRRESIILKRKKSKFKNSLH